MINILLAFDLFFAIFAGRWALPACESPEPARVWHTAKGYFDMIYYPSGFV